jgi:hypothetical protein
MCAGDTLFLLSRPVNPVTPPLLPYAFLESVTLLTFIICA